MHIRLRIGGVLDAATRERVASALAGDAEDSGVQHGLIAAARGKVAFAWSGEGDDAQLTAIEQALGQDTAVAWRLEASPGSSGPVRVSTRRGDLGWAIPLRWVDVPGMAPAIPLDDLVAWIECQEEPLAVAVEMMGRIMGQGSRPELPSISLANA